MRLKRINEGQGWMIASTLGTAAILDHLERDYLREQNSLKVRAAWLWKGQVADRGSLR